MASQVHMANYQANSFVGVSTGNADSFRGTTVAEPGPSEKVPPAPEESPDKASTPEVIAHGVEFVALPEEAEKLQTEIPETVRSAFGKCTSFSGCMVLVSEQEARLVTVITLWTGSERVRQCNENSKRLKRLLTPYVDRWLRTRRLAAFLSTR